MLGDTDGAIVAGEEAVELGRRLGYDTQIAGGFASLGFAVGAVDAERSVDLLRESLEIKDDTTYSAVARVLLANLELLLGRLLEALKLFCEVLEVHLTFGDSYFVPMSLEGMASVFALLGRPESAARLLGASAGGAARSSSSPGWTSKLRCSLVRSHSWRAHWSRCGRGGACGRSALDAGRDRRVRRYRVGGSPGVR